MNEWVNSATLQTFIAPLGQLWSYQRRFIMPRREMPISRQQQAFEMLLDQQYAANPLPASASGKGDRRAKKSNRTVSDKRASDKVPGFVLRDSEPGQQPSPQSSTQLEQLYSMFGNSLDRSTIKHVFLQCERSVEASIDELLTSSERKQSEAMAGSSSRAQEPAQPAGIRCHSHLQPAVLYHTTSLSAHCVRYWDKASSMVAGQPAGSSYWSWLPEECKGLVLRHLDSKDHAKAARTSKEFAEHIRTVRAGLGVLNVPPGKSCPHWLLQLLIAPFA